MIKKTKICSLFLVFVITMFGIIMNAHAINAKAIRNTSASILYGSKVISKSLLDNMLKEIAKPETNPRIFLVRDLSEAKKTVQTSIASIEDKLKNPSADESEFINMNTRVARFLDILKTEFAQEELEKSVIELSFLLEAVDGGI